MEKFDVIIFGATGYTGKFVVREFDKICGKKYKWAIAGRSESKMKDLLEQFFGDSVYIPIVVANCRNVVSLENMAKKCRLIINCCGPFRFFGENLVKACISNHCHHVDVSGEPQYMENMQLLHHAMAEENSVYVISACGFDSIPADMGVLYFIKNYEGLVNSIECYMSFKSNSSASYGPSVNYATWESAVHGFANQNELIAIRKKLYENVTIPKLEPKLKQRSIIHKSELFENKYSVPFPGSDKSVVFRTQIFLHQCYEKRPVQFQPYCVCNSILSLTTIFFIGFFLQMLTKFTSGINLLLKHPRLFSFGIVSRNLGLSDGANVQPIFRFKGKGWTTETVEAAGGNLSQIPPNKTEVMELRCNNSAYHFTATAVVLSAITILEESENMPSKGGVYTPGGAFYKTQLMEKLKESSVSISYTRIA